MNQFGKSLALLAFFRLGNFVKRDCPGISGAKKVRASYFLDAYPLLPCQLLLAVADNLRSFMDRYSLMRGYFGRLLLAVNQHSAPNYRETIPSTIMNSTPHWDTHSHKPSFLSLNPVVKIQHEPSLWSLLTTISPRFCWQITDCCHLPLYH